MRLVLTKTNPRLLIIKKTAVRKHGILDTSNSRTCKSNLTLAVATFKKETSQLNAPSNHFLQLLLHYI